MSLGGLVCSRVLKALDFSRCRILPKATFFFLFCFLVKAINLLYQREKKVAFKRFQQIIILEDLYNFDIFLKKQNIPMNQLSHP